MCVRYKLYSLEHPLLTLMTSTEQEYYSRTAYAFEHLSVIYFEEYIEILSTLK